MKLIHCADLHLDSKMTSLLPADLAKTRRQELLQTFVRMVDFAEEEGVSAILIAGDLFDRKTVSSVAGNTVFDEICSHPDISFFYITGNHERSGFLDSLSEIPDNLKLFGKEWRTYDAGPVAVSGADPDPDAGPERYASLVLDPSCFNIVILHGQITEYADASQKESIPLRELRGKPVDYLALGHVHSFQEGTIAPRGTWCYPGCLEGRGFDECGEHGFVLLDINTEDRTCTKTFVPFAARKLEEIPVDISGCLTTAEIAERIGEQIREKTGRQAGEETGQLSGRKPVTEDFWKIVLTGQVDITCEKETEWLEKRYADRCGFLKVEDHTRLAVEYRDYARDVSLKGEFVRLVGGDDSLNEQQKAEIIRCGLRALSGEELPV